MPIKITEWALSDAVYLQKKCDRYDAAMREHEARKDALQARKDAGEDVVIPHKPKMEEPERLPGFIYSGAGPDCRIFEVETTNGEGRVAVTKAVQNFVKAHKKAPEAVYVDDNEMAAADAW